MYKQNVIWEKRPTKWNVTSTRNAASVALCDNEDSPPFALKWQTFSLTMLLIFCALYGWDIVDILKWTFLNVRGGGQETHTHSHTPCSTLHWSAHVNQAARWERTPLQLWLWGRDCLAGCLGYWKVFHFHVVALYFVLGIRMWDLWRWKLFC